MYTESGRVKALITHGGYNSLMEACHFGVPTIVIPMCGDQFSNAQRIERLKIGVVLQKSELTLENLEAALDQVLNNRAY